jgi:type I restriction enzyme S subunit
MPDWKEKKIKEFCDFKYGKNLPEHVRSQGKYPVYGSASITSYHNDYLIEAPGIIIGRKGTVGKVQLAKNNFYPIDTTFYIDRYSTAEDILFLYYRFQLCGFSEMNSDAAVPGLNRNAAINQKIKLPLIGTQQKIATILSAYDDLIENNLKRIKLLEEMAQITYEEWFVRLKFPSHETTPMDLETDLPLGWERRSLLSVADFLNGFAFKPEDLGENGYPIIKIKEIKNGVESSTPRNEGKDNPDKYIVNEGDILFSWSASLEVVIWQYETGLLNQHLFKVMPNCDIPKSFLFLALRESLPIFDNLTTGATMKHIKRKELDFVKIVVPHKDLLDEFNKFADSTFQAVLNLNRQIRFLKEARDILLPRLMTGMIDVDSIQLPDSLPIPGAHLFAKY